jgi:hypothetical protein
MKLRVIFNTGVTGPQAVNLIELEATGYTIDPRLGTLSILRQVGQAHEVAVVYAAGVWRSVADVGALQTAIAAARPPPEAAQRENPRRSQEARQAREA